MNVISYEQWRAWSPIYSMLPVINKHSLKEDRLIGWKEAWQRSSKHAFLLESGKAGRYTFFGMDPVSTISGKGLTATVREAGSDSNIEWQGSPLSLVKNWMAPYDAPRVKEAPKFIGGCVGFWGYDVARYIEKLPQQSADDLQLPDYCFMRFDQIWIVDHHTKELYCTVHSKIDDVNNDDDLLRERYERAILQLDEMKKQWDLIASINEDIAAQETYAQRKRMIGAQAADESGMMLPNIERSFTKDRFINAVKNVQQHIANGEVFQVNLSTRQNFKLTAEPGLIYDWLRLINPSPYMGYLQFEDFQIISASPELLVQQDEHFVRTRPIGGTRPRGKTPEEDAGLAKELLDNEKERAEHIMLVDLERNDLGRVSRYGSVKVEELMAIEYYSHVMHIVSEVQGELAEGKDAYDVIAAVFPGGTITGAPKVRTMEIIEELEPVRRGPYTGSMGWIDYNGNIEFNIIIRTLVMTQGQGYVQAGAGIVIDSVAEKEYTESLLKARALWKAIQLSEQENSSHDFSH